MRVHIEASLQYFLPQPTDILLVVEVIPMQDQFIIEDLLTVKGCGPLRVVDGGDNLGRRTWMEANGALDVLYTATVGIDRAVPNVTGLPITPRRELPAEAIPYLFPSRYCESDRFEDFVNETFGHVSGGDAINAISNWVYNNLSYVSGASDADTTAINTFQSQQGVCRDYAHLLIALSRAAGVPARMVSVYALGLSPPDFHAVVEVWLAGKWHLIDATRLAPPEHFVRIAVGRDATDISFLTSFGQAEFNYQSITVTQA